MSKEIAVELRILSNQELRKAKAKVTFDTELGELTIVQLTVLQKNGEDPWVSMPSISFPDKKNPGKTVYMDTVLPGHRLRRAISDAVLAKYRELSDAPF